MTDRSAVSRSGSGIGAAGSASLADEVIDELVPADLDWRSLVSAYPKAAIGLVAVAGFWLGRTRGSAILAGISGLAAETVNESINEFFGRDVV